MNRTSPSSRASIAASSAPPAPSAVSHSMTSGGCAAGSSRCGPRRADRGSDGSPRARRGTSVHRSWSPRRTRPGVRAARWRCAAPRRRSAPRRRCGSRHARGAAPARGPRRAWAHRQRCGAEDRAGRFVPGGPERCTFDHRLDTTPRVRPGAIPEPTVDSNPGPLHCEAAWPGNAEVPTGEQGAPGYADRAGARRC